MFFGDSPSRPGFAETLVATTTSSRLPREASHCPITVSDSPPELPSTQYEYMSALSRKFPPRSTKPSRTAWYSSGASGSLKVLVPKPSG